MKTPFAFFNIFGLTFMLLSCAENTDEVANQALDQQIILDENVMNNLLDEVYRMSDEAIFRASVEEGSNNASNYCAALSQNKQEQMISLDFGIDGCVDNAGILRKGQIEIQYSGVAGSLLSARKIIFHDYYVNEKKITGSIITSDFTRNEIGNIEFIRSHQNITISFENKNEFFTGNSTYLIEWIEGEGDLDFYNNVYELSGSAWGVSRKREKYTSQIVHPVTLQTTCFNNHVYYPVSGASQINPANGKYYRVDFGNGECDKTTTIKVGNQTFQVELP